ncbi:MAG: glycosyltransferase family 4 protein, partial [Candidatus Binatia bacterium]
AMIALLLRSLVRAPVILDYQGSLSRELVDHRFVSPRGLLRRLFARIEQWIERRADVVIVSTGQALDLVRQNRPNGRRTVVVEDAVDTTPAPGSATAEAAARAYGLPEGRPIVVFMGLLTPYQGIDYLLEAIPAVFAERADVHFLVIGFPEGEYRMRVAARDIASSVTFTGKVPYEVTPALLSLATVAVSPKVSQSEGNLKLYSYMAAGLPTVVFDTPVNRDILGDLGVYAPAGDSLAFARGILALVGDAGRRSEIAARLRERAARERSWDRQAERIEEVYRAVAPAVQGQR